MFSTFTVVTTDHDVTTTTAGTYRDVVRAAAVRLGCEPYVLVSGTYAVAYCSARRCGGHEIARVFDDYQPNETTAANRATAIAAATAANQIRKA